MTAANVLIEDTVEQVRAVLQAGMPAAAAAVAAKYAAADTAAGRSVPLPEPVTYAFGLHAAWGVDRPLVATYYLGGMKLRQPGQVQGGSGEAFYDVPVGIDLLFESDNEEVLERQVYRYAEAVFNCLSANTVLANDAHPSGYALESHLDRNDRAGPITPNQRQVRWTLTVQLIVEF